MIDAAVTNVGIGEDQFMNIAFKAPVERGNTLDDLSATLLRPMGVDGVYARTAPYEQVVDAL